MTDRQLNLPQQTVTEKMKSEELEAKTVEYRRSGLMSGKAALVE